MAKLYRSPRELNHWFVHIPGTGWARFPAKIDGWGERRIVTKVSQQLLNRVPLWLAFNTGLLEALESRDQERRASIGQAAADAILRRFAS